MDVRQGMKGQWDGGDEGRTKRMQKRDDMHRSYEEESMGRDGGGEVMGDLENVGIGIATELLD